MYSIMRHVPGEAAFKQNENTHRVQ